MVKNIEELKELILWSKEQKLTAVKIGDVEFHFSNLALAELSKLNLELEQPTEGLSETDEKQKKQDIDDLFWSSRG